MILTFGPRGILQIDDATIMFRNFSGAAGKFNKEGDRSFHLLIDGGTVIDGNKKREVTAEEMADILAKDANKFGVGWNVKSRESNDGDVYYHMMVKVRFNDRGPRVYMISGRARNTLGEDKIHELDNCTIASVDLDIRPYDDEINGKPFRSAYLQSMHVVQEVDRFAARYAEEEFPGEDPFDDDIF